MGRRTERGDSDVNFFPVTFGLLFYHVRDWAHITACIHAMCLTTHRTALTLAAQ